MLVYLNEIELNEWRNEYEMEIFKYARVEKDNYSCIEKADFSYLNARLINVFDTLSKLWSLFYIIDS